MSELFFNNFEQALKKLTEFCKNFDGTEIQQAGIIQAFEFTFEQAWKAIQKKAGTEGVTIASPKKAFQWALENGWLKSTDEQAWIEIFSDRNLTSHTYRAAMAQQVSQNVITNHVQQFVNLLVKMKQ